MDTEKTKRVYTLDELKDKAGPAAAVPKLVEIVKTAPLTKDGKINLTWVRNQAHQYVLEETGDVKDAKKLADSARFLAKLRQDFEDEFEKSVAQEKQPKPEIKPVEKKKRFDEIEFELPNYRGMEITCINRMGFASRYSMKFSCGLGFELNSRNLGKEFCMEILNALIETADPPGDTALMNDLIQLLEKFGLKIKVCGNCKHFAMNHRHCDLADCNLAGHPVYVFERPRCTTIDGKSGWTHKEREETTELIPGCGGMIRVSKVTGRAV